jgi:AcrR family transcriptional regulator
MSPRPRKASDDEVFMAAQRAMTRLGPGELTLADIAGEAGLTAGALATLRAYADCMAHMAASPAAFARNFAYLQIDLTDPDFRPHLAKAALSTRAELQKLIVEAMDAGELAPATNARQLARTVEAVVGGSMLSWAFHQEGPAAKWMRHDLDAVLKPYIL